jgi:hypothetical protein
MRSLSALAGTASIGVVYLTARALPVPRRGALIVAAVVAVSPVLIWFSQDARAYALVFLLAALSFLFFAGSRRGGAGRDLAWWGVFSALALATHYFAGFLVAPEAALEEVNIAGWHITPDFGLDRDDGARRLRDHLAELAERVTVRVLLWAGAPLPVFARGARRCDGSATNSCGGRKSAAHSTRTSDRCTATTRSS